LKADRIVLVAYIGYRVKLNGETWDELLSEMIRAFSILGNTVKRGEVNIKEKPALGVGKRW